MSDDLIERLHQLSKPMISGSFQSMQQRAMFDAAAEIKRLRMALHKAILHMEEGENHNEGAFDESCDTCVLLRELRAIHGGSSNAKGPANP